MIIIILFCLLLSVFLVRARVDDKISKFIIYSFIVYWFVALSISTFQPMGFFRISDYSYFLLLLGVLSFVWGFIFMKQHGVRYSASNTDILTSLDRILKNKYLVILFFLLAIYYFSYAKDAIMASAVNGKAVRATSESSLYAGNRMFLFMYSMVGYQLFHFCMVILPISLFYYKRQYFLPILVLMFFVISFFIINAGRSSFMIMLLYVLIMYCIYKKGIFKITIKNVSIITSIVIIVLLGMSAITNFRDYGTFQMDEKRLSETLDDTNEKILSYSILPIVLFDRSIEKDYMTKFNGPFLGRATFAGPELYTGNIMKRIDSDYKTINDVVINYIQNNYFPTSPTVSSNFAYTGIFFHYLDFGILGVIIFPFIFGLFFRYIILSFYKRQNLALLTLIGFLYFMMMYSVFSCYLIKPWVTFYIPLLLFLGFKSSKQTLICKQKLE